MLNSFLEKINSFFRQISGWFTDHAVWTCILIFLLSLGLKILVWLGNPVVSRDGALYLQVIQTLHDAGSILEVYKLYPEAARISPLYFYLVSGVMAFGAGVEFSGVLVNVVLGSLICIVGYGMVQCVTGNRKISLVAALFLAVHPMVAELSGEVQREIPYLFFSGCAIWLAFAALKKWYWWFGAGVFLALAQLSRYEAVELLLLFPVAITALAVCRKISWKQAVLGLLALIVSFLTVFSAFLYLTGNTSQTERYCKYFNSRYNVHKQGMK